MGQFPLDSVHFLPWNPLSLSGHIVPVLSLPTFHRKDDPRSIFSREGIEKFPGRFSHPQRRFRLLSRYGSGIRNGSVYSIHSRNPFCLMKSLTPLISSRGAIAMSFLRGAEN